KEKQRGGRTSSAKPPSHRALRGKHRELLSVPFSAISVARWLNRLWAWRRPLTGYAAARAESPLAVFEPSSPPTIQRRAGVAMNTVLYVPTNTPISIANAKAWMPEPPKKYSTSTTINVVNAVSNVRLRVWLTALLIISLVSRGLLPLIS